MIPLVSICIPAYNAQRFVAETLESALEQTYPNIEIVVSDDCSTDRTAEIVKQYESKGIRLIRQPTNLGRYGNANAVIRASKGEYVLKLDADDLVDPDHITQQATVMQAYPQVVFAHVACRLIDADGKFIGYERSIHGSFIRTGAEEWPRYVSGPRAVNIVTLRRSAFDQIGGYDERYTYSGDWTMHRALLRIGDVFYNDNVLASYRAHSVGKAGIRLIQAQEHLMHLEDMERDWPPEVAGKQRLLKRARLKLGLAVARSAAHCESHERAQVLAYLPEYGNGWQIKLLARFVRLGGAPLVRQYYESQLLMRQVVKSFLYRKAKK
ncbi:MAG TPA: glycosyltransferase [Anaerolineae bacterium]|nr:glycosyltransferase [Anaerolineae bacterium]